MKTGSRNKRLSWTLLLGTSVVAICAIVGGCGETRLTGLDLDGNRVDLFGDRNAKAIYPSLPMLAVTDSSRSHV